MFTDNINIFFKDQYIDIVSHALQQQNIKLKDMNGCVSMFVHRFYDISWKAPLYKLERGSQL